jgi:hypothetical protein
MDDDGGGDYTGCVILFVSQLLETYGTLMLCPKNLMHADSVLNNFFGKNGIKFNNNTRGYVELEVYAVGKKSSLFVYVSCLLFTYFFICVTDMKILFYRRTVAGL